VRVVVVVERVVVTYGEPSMRSLGLARSLMSIMSSALGTASNSFSAIERTDAPPPPLPPPPPPPLSLAIVPKVASVWAESEEISAFGCSPKRRGDSEGRPLSMNMAYSLKSVSLGSGERSFGARRVEAMSSSLKRTSR